MPKLKKSPLAPARFQKLPALKGARLSARACGIKYKGRKDVLLIDFAPGTAIAGVFTRSLTAGPAVRWCREALKGGKGRAIVVNAGNANVFTGESGWHAADATATAAAQVLGCKAKEVFVASTGVIGEPLPVGRIVGGLPALAKALKADAWRAAAEAIMTTDTFPKLASRSATIGKTTVTLNGIAKGSGMIEPDMATMLAFVATDAKIPAAALQAMLKRGADRSFNCMTVDGDTSTSDSLILAATGQAKHPRVAKASDKNLQEFRAALEDLLIDLAQQVARDGEGASKFVTVSISGAKNADSAKRVGRAIANSPLVKTAIAGEDANWGRIVMAVGKSGEPQDQAKLAVSIGGVRLTEKGARRPDYDEAPVTAHMKGKEIEIAVDLGMGRGKATIWTCDLTHGYIAINGDYRS
ncbi:MAG: bifunctional glutamate N-acetyltransferase/amino-acid acetyltransferase ArgJ [Rhodovibrionaceae bacterium]